MGFDKSRLQRLGSSRTTNSPANVFFYDVPVGDDALAIGYFKAGDGLQSGDFVHFNGRFHRLIGFDRLMAQIYSTGPP